MIFYFAEINASEFIYKRLCDSGNLQNKSRNMHTMCIENISKDLKCWLNMDSRMGVSCTDKFLLCLGNFRNCKQTCLLIRYLKQYDLNIQTVCKVKNTFPLPWNFHLRMLGLKKHILLPFVFSKFHIFNQSYLISLSYIFLVFSWYFYYLKNVGTLRYISHVPCLNNAMYLTKSEGKGQSTPGK